MADPIPVVVDVFKFVAVRPAQLATTEDTSRSVIHDARAGTVDGQRVLTRLARSIRTPGEALERFEELDLSSLGPLAEAQRRLTELYAAGSVEDPPTPADALRAAGLANLTTEGAQPLADTAWEALYTAYRSGPDAGQRLDTATAALRALHFAALVRSDALTHPDDVVEALEAIPVVPTPIAAMAPKPAAPPSQPTVPEPQEPTPQHERLRSLVKDFGLTRRLLDLARSTPALSQSDMSSAPLDPKATDQVITRQNFWLTTSPRFLKATRADVAPPEAALLDRLGIRKRTSVPTATGILQDHLAQLTRQVYELRNDPQLPTVVRELATTYDVSDAAKVLSPHQIASEDPGKSPDVDVSGRIRPLGIGDLKVVKQTLLAYEPGEVAHIENVLRGESKQRIHRTLDRTETTVFESMETTEDNERDTQTTERFELKKEAEQTIKEDMSIQAGVTVTGAFGPVTVTAHGDFAYSTSREESAKSSSNFARDIVDRSVTKVQKKVKTERTTKTFHETEETDTHALTATDADVVGVYRWVDKRYRAQVYNYGRRLMLEFLVPEPAAFFHASQAPGPPAPADAVPPDPLLDLNKQPLTATDITPQNYRIFVSRYNVSGVSTPPPEYVYVGTAFEQNEIENGKTFSKSVKDVLIPEGYTLWYYDAKITAIWSYYPQMSLQIGESIHHLLASTEAIWGATFGVGYASWPDDTSDDPRGVLPISVVGYDINAYAVNIEAVCQRSSEALEEWQLQTFDKIYTAYQALKTAYDQKVTQAQTHSMGVFIEGRNPQVNLEIIKRELKKLCLTMLTGHHWNEFEAMTNPPDPPAHLPEVDVLKALSEGPVIQFFEQAFDWEQITYLLFPYFWGRKSKWVALSNHSDPDPLFMQFLQAGACRVVVPVSPAYTNAMLYFLQSMSPNLKDKIWLGGNPPTIDDPLFLSIADELKAQTDDLAGALPEGSPWEFTIPTALVWLQGDSTLPTFK